MSEERVKFILLLVDSTETCQSVALTPTKIYSLLVEAKCINQEQ
jgi:hypothetical protein